MKRTLLLLMYICIQNVLFANTLLVPSQFPTIQSAIVASVVGDTVLVSPGVTYVENLNFLGKDIVVKTPNPLTDKWTTILDGNFAGSVVVFINNETNAAKLEGFTLRKGTGTVRSWWYYLGFNVLSGGGILCDSPIAFNQAANPNGSSPTLSNLIIENNSAEAGGGICCWKTSRPVISNTIIRNNNATGIGGGCYFIEAFNVSTGNPILLENVEVTHNTCNGTVGGSGVVINYTSKAKLINCTVANNTATNPVGESLFRANGSVFEIHNSVFWDFLNDLLYDQGGTAAQSTIDYSCAINFNGPITNVIGNTSATPDFVNPAINDYHLLVSSACINSGNVLNATLIDLDGNIRDAQPDMGAFEYLSGVPQPAIASSDSSFCDKGSVDFYDLSTNNPTSWQWTFTGATPSTSTLQNPTGIYYPTNGSFDVELIACNAVGCDTILIPAFITEYPLPTAPVISQSNDTLFSTPAATYQWYLIPNPIPGATNQYYVVTQSGSYFVLITDSIGCEVASTSFDFVGAGLTPTLTSNSIQLFSLNNEGSYQLICKDLLQNDLQLCITDELGRLIYTSTIDKTSTIINLQPFPKGLYFIQVYSENYFVTKKLIR